MGLGFIFQTADILNAFRDDERVIKCIFSSGTGPFAGEVLGNVNSPRHSFLAQWLNYCGEGKKKMGIHNMFGSRRLPVLMISTAGFIILSLKSKHT